MIFKPCGIQTKPFHKSVIMNLTVTKTLSDFFIKGTLSSLRPFLAIKSPLKMMKNAFYFTLKAFFFLKIFEFLS